MADANSTGCARPYLEIICAAATAPTVYDALDVAGDVLRRLTKFARVEIRHG